MKKWPALLLLLVTACSRVQPESERLVSVPQAPVAEPAPQAPAPQTPVTPVPAPPVPPSARQADLNGDGKPEEIKVEKDGWLRIFAENGTRLYEFQIPSKSDHRVKLEVHPFDSQPPLLHVSWPWCPRDYPDNLFVWYDQAAGAFRNNRKADAIMGPCGVYEYQGSSRFTAEFHYESFYFTRQEHWENDHLVLDSTRTQLLRARIDQIPMDLGRLIGYNVYNPEAWFDPPSLCQEFKSRAQKDWRFTQVGEPDGKTLRLQITVGEKPQGNLQVSYRTESPWVIITGLRWDP